MSEVFDQSQLDIQSPENAVQAFEERGESLEGHMERGSIEDCPVMGRMSEDAQQFIVSRVVQHAEKASAFKGMSMADILAKKRQTNVPEVEAPKPEAAIEPVTFAHEANLQQVEIEKTIDLFTLETTEVELAKNVHQEQIINTEPTPIQLEAKPSLDQKIVINSNAQLPKKLALESPTKMSPEITEPEHPEEKPVTPKVKKVVPTVTGIKFKEAHHTKKEFVPIPEIIHPEESAPIVEPLTEVDAVVEFQDKPVETPSVQPIESEITQLEVESTEVSEKDRLPKTEVAIDQIVNEALLQIEEIQSQPDLVQTSLETTVEEAPIVVVIAEIADEILNLSEVPETVDELKQTIVTLIAQRSDILEQFDMKVVWPYIEQLIEAIQSSNPHSGEYLNRLNSDGTHEHKFYALWQGKSIGVQTDRYHRVSSFILGNAYLASV